MPEWLVIVWDNFMKYELDASERLKNLMHLASPMTTSDVEVAIKRFQSNHNEADSYGDSTGYDLICLGERYPPKAIFGLALSSILNESIYSNHFTGGLGSECFKVLTKLGFDIVNKSGQSINELNNVQEKSPVIKATSKRPIIIGDVQGIQKGDWFKDRKEMMPSSFHRVWTSGIDGNGREGAAAIVLSGGYADDVDYGDEIIYTGAGGNKDGKQISDQSWSQSGNAGLLTSMDQGLPVRVVRGYQHKSEFSPKSGYLYSGLFRVVDSWEETGKEGFKICRYKLVYSDENPISTNNKILDFDAPKGSTERRVGTILRMVRDSNISRRIKELYAHQCQVCSTAIRTKSGFYSEGAHIKPLGRPHNGDDSIDNLLCLCPNHHVMFDKGMFSVGDDFSLLGDDVAGKLIVHNSHPLNVENFKYHRLTHGFGS